MAELENFLKTVGKKLGIKDMKVLNDFIDASIFAALEPIQERLNQLEKRLEQLQPLDPDSGEKQPKSPVVSEVATKEENKGT